MDALHLLLAGSIAFVGSHFALSHPLRRPLVAALGEQRFLVLYSVVAFATLGLTVHAYRRAPAGAPLWQVGDGIWALSTVAMLAASILLLGSFVRNPAAPGAAASAATADAHGVYAITRHPMMWAFAIWGASHILVYPVARNIILAGAIIVLALAGAALQDRKKAGLDPAGWHAWQSRTSYLPFVAIAQRRARFGRFGMHALAGGLVVWLLASWAHGPLAGWPAGVWRYF